MTRKELETNVRAQLNTGRGKIYYGSYVFHFFGRLDPVTLQEIYDLTVLSPSESDFLVVKQLNTITREETIDTIFSLIVRERVEESLC